MSAVDMQRRRFEHTIRFPPFLSSCATRSATEAMREQRERREKRDTERQTERESRERHRERHRETERERERLRGGRGEAREVHTHTHIHKHTRICHAAPHLCMRLVAVLFKERAKIGRLLHAVLAVTQPSDTTRECVCGGG